MPRIRLHVAASPCGAAVLTAFRDAIGVSLSEARSGLQGKTPLLDGELDKANQRNAIAVLKTIDRQFALQLHKAIVGLKRNQATFHIECDGETISEDRLREMVNEEHVHAETYGRPQPGAFGFVPDLVTLLPSAPGSPRDPLLERLALCGGDLPHALEELGIPYVESEYGLREISLRGSSVTDAGLSAFRSLHQLVSLSVGPLTTDAGLEWLGKLRGLKSLDLSGSRVEGSGLAHLTGVPSLNVLDLSKTALTDEGLRQLPPLHVFTELILDDTKITDFPLRFLADRKYLRKLSLRRTMVAGSGLYRLEGIDSLRELWLDSTYVSDNTLHNLAVVPLTRHVVTLGLSGCAVTDIGVAALAKFPELLHVDLSSTLVTDSCIETLGAVTGLRTVDLHDTGVSREGWLKLRAARPTLWILSSYSQADSTPDAVMTRPAVLALVERRSDQPTAPVEDSWRRLEAWLASHLPEVHASLRPPATEDDLAAFERMLGRALPEDLRKSWLVHDGQSSANERGARAEGAIFGLPLLSIAGISASWRAEWGGGLWGGSEPANPDEAAARSSVSPVGMIRPERRHRGYIPIYEDRAGNALGIDLDPGPEGIVGQVINFGPDETFKHVLALSWGQFLEDVADELEAGHAFVTPPDECDERTPRFGLRGSPEGWLFHILPEWSRAKLPGR